MCVNVYAELIASMTIHLMENGEHGDTRVKDELSRMVDITPNPLMTHQGFMETIVRTLMTEGNQVTLPVFAGGLLMQLDPAPPSRVTFVPEGRGYRAERRRRIVCARRGDPFCAESGSGISVAWHGL